MADAWGKAGGGVKQGEGNYPGSKIQKYISCLSHMYNFLQRFYEIYEFIFMSSYLSIHIERVFAKKIFSRYSKHITRLFIVAPNKTAGRPPS